MQLLCCGECDFEFDADEEMEAGEIDSVNELHCPSCGADSDALTGS